MRISSPGFRKFLSFVTIISFFGIQPTFAALVLNNGNFSDTSGMTNAGGWWYHGNPNNWTANGTNQYVINNNILNLDQVGIFTQNIGTVSNGGEKISVSFDYGDLWNGGYYAPNENMILAQIWDTTSNNLLASKTVKNTASFGTMDSTSFSNTNPATVGHSIELRFMWLAGTGITPGNAAAIDNVSIATADGAAPVITLTWSSTATVEVGSVYTDAGATASDNVDGDRTSNIIVVNPVNTNVLGTYTITYDVSDIAGNNATQVTRTVNVVDTTKPIITLAGSPIVSVNFGATYTDAGATASDNVDGDLTSSIVTVNPVNTGTIGTYTVTYDVTDSHSNVANQVSRSVEVVDVTSPTIAITGANPMTVEVGHTYTELGAVATDDVDGTFAATPSGSVDTNIVGAYTISYDAVDSSTNSATTVTRTVNVVDTTPPVITLLGLTPVDTEWKQVYTDAGATASDNVDGDISSSIITVNSVNALLLGMYTVIYNVTDAHGNPSTTVTRTVNVVDTTPPVAPVVQRPSQLEVIETATSNTEGTCETDATVTISGSSLVTNPTTTTCVGGKFLTQITFTGASHNTSFVLTFTQTDPSGNTSPAVQYNITYTTPQPTSGWSGSPHVDDVPSTITNNTTTTTITPSSPSSSGDEPTVTSPVNPTPTQETPVPPSPVELPDGNTSNNNSQLPDGSQNLTTAHNNTPVKVFHNTPKNPSFSTKETTLDAGGGVLPEEAQPSIISAETTVDIWGWVVPEEKSYTLLWILLGTLALLNIGWYFVSKNRDVPPTHRRD